MASLQAVFLLALTLVSQLVAAHPALRYLTEKRQVDIDDEYDYIIVGGGTSGLTVGDRLTAGGQCQLIRPSTSKEAD
jgi:ribulose 1,5-bisphosphate synthetase/thiazole synthase